MSPPDDPEQEAKLKAQQDQQLKTKQKSRVAVRGWCTRKSKTLDTLLQSKPPVSAAVLEDAIQEFDLQLEQLDVVQSELQFLIEDETEMLADLDDAADFRDNVRKNRILAVEKLNTLLAAAQPLPTTPPASSSGDISTALAEVKLPKLELKKFRGDILEYEAWWDVFLLIHESTTIPTISKFVYLKSCLEGEAAQAIAGLKVSEANYETAIEIITNRFGGKDKRVFTHMTQLIGLSCSKPTVDCLRGLRDQLLSHTRSLENLEITKEQYGVFLTPLVISKLPQEIRMEWSRDAEGKERDIDYLLTFLESEIKRRDRSLTVGDTQQPQVQGVSSHVKSHQNKPSGHSLLSGAGGEKTCGLCNKKGHKSSQCYKITKTPRADRMDVAKTAGVCFLCLQPGHSSVRCGKPVCNHCGGRHHSVLCGKINSDKNSESITTEQSEPAKLSARSNMPSGSVLLKCAQVAVKDGGGGVVTARIIFDDGCSKTYVRKVFSKRINAIKVDVDNFRYAAFGTKAASEHCRSNVVSICLQDLGGSDHVIHATEIDNISAPLHRPAVPAEILQRLSAVAESFVFADKYSHSVVADIDILIGMDTYWRFIDPSSSVRLTPELVSLNTPFGLVISGKMPCSKSDSAAPHMLSMTVSLLCPVLSLNDVKDFYEIENIGVVDEPERDMLTTFREGLSVDEEGRYSTNLVWKPNMKEKLLDNEKIARRRQAQTSRKLARNPAVRKLYDDALSELEKAGVIEEVPEEELKNPVGDTVYYMPGRPELRPEAVSTKCRPVFDAGCKGYNGVSLNDCLDPGPCLLADLVGVLLRFRRWEFAITADIHKAFFQIVIKKEDRDVHRFLWDVDDVIKVMRFTRVPFGNSQSPFLWLAMLSVHFSKYPESDTLTKLKEDIYMDDWLTGCDGVSVGCHMIQEASEIMDDCHCSLVKISSSNQVISDVVQDLDLGKCLDSETVKTLGMIWSSVEDCFMFQGPSFAPNLKLSKRVVLSFFSKLFDPINFLAPFTVDVKILFQELWKVRKPSGEKLTWDEEIPVEFQEKFLKWVDGLKVVKAWKIPRRYSSCMKWSDSHIKFILVGFGDASPQAYGACVYLLMESGDFRSISLVMAKSRVAPLKSQTLPRLELMAGLVLARLITHVRQQLNLPVSTPLHCFSDAKITLSWIKGDPERWVTFVRNRVKEIHKLTPPDCWHYVPSAKNPADLLTRGISAQDLVASQLWLHGPPELLDDVTLGDVSIPTDDVDIQDMSTKEDVILLSTAQSQKQKPVSVLDIERWDPLTKAIRVVGWVKRFIRNLKACLPSADESNKTSSADKSNETSESPEKSPVDGPKKSSLKNLELEDLDFDELVDARKCLIRDAQLKSYASEMFCLDNKKEIPSASVLRQRKLITFLDDDGLLRIKHRLDQTNLSYDEKNPIILPKGHLAVLVVRFQHILLKHAGVDTMLTSLRSEFWLPGGRLLAKRVKKFCVACQKQDARACAEPTPSLPRVRVSPAPPFRVCGLDHAGPLYCLDFANTKFYILLFTCAVTRAVFLELVDSMSTPSTMFALRRMAARRGLPRNIFSDNHKGFKKCPKMVGAYFGHKAPKWEFIAPLSPWRGGWWERLVKSVKSSLKKTICKAKLSRVELETTIHEVEACVNSRPLTYVSDDVTQREPLTPAHFLLGHSGGFYGNSNVDSQSVASDEATLTLEFERRRCLIDEFFRIWSNDYIRNLPPCGGSRHFGGISENNLVLLEDATTTRLNWPVGIVEKVFPSPLDGVVRTAEVKTTQGMYTRPIQRLHKLELWSNDFVPENDDFVPENDNFAPENAAIVPENENFENENEHPDNPQNSEDDFVENAVDEAKNEPPVTAPSSPPVVRKTRTRVVREPDRLNLVVVRTAD